MTPIDETPTPPTTPFIPAPVEKRKRSYDAPPVPEAVHVEGAIFRPTPTPDSNAPAS